MLCGKTGTRLWHPKMIDHYYTIGIMRFGRAPIESQKCQNTPVSRTTKCKYFQSHTNRNRFMHPKGKSDNDNRSCSQHPNVPETESLCLVPELNRIANTIRCTVPPPMRDMNPFLQVNGATSNKFIVL